MYGGAIFTDVRYPRFLHTTFGERVVSRAFVPGSASYVRKELGPPDTDSTKEEQTDV